MAVSYDNHFSIAKFLGDFHVCSALSNLNLNLNLKIVTFKTRRFLDLGVS
jgi:hypothetical protein